MIYSKDLILEVAILQIVDKRNEQFEAAFHQASTIISAMTGYYNHELRRCIEHGNQYILLVWWNNLEDHTIGFRQSAQYLEWKALLHKFYDPFPEVLHYSVSLV